MNGTVYQNQAGVLELETLNGGQTAMGGAVVDNPKHAAGLVVGRTCHHLINKPVKWSDATATFTAPKGSRTSYTCAAPTVYFYTR
jgi:hypothetical protein